MTNETTISDHFKWYYVNGYITARDGNAAVRTDKGYLVTASGTRKHDLQYENFVVVDDDRKVLESRNESKPSIETGAHIAVLRSSKKNASVHVHSPNTVALAALFEPFGGFKPQCHNLVRVLNERWPELFRWTRIGCVVPYLDPGSNKLHDCIVHSLTYWDNKVEFDEEGEPITFDEVKLFNNIVIMQRHGVLAIGDSMDECMEHIVRLEHISTILLKIITASGSLESIL